MTDFIFLGSQITVDGDSSHEFKRCLLLGRKAVTNLSNVLKNRDITLLTKVCIVKAMIFLVVMYWCEGWTIKKAEQWRIDTFEFWCWRRLLRVPRRARKSKQSILKEINPEYSLEGLRHQSEPPSPPPPHPIRLGCLRALKHGFETCILPFVKQMTSASSNTLL